MFSQSQVHTLSTLQIVFTVYSGVQKWESGLRLFDPCICFQGQTSFSSLFFCTLVFVELRNVFSAVMCDLIRLYLQEEQYHEAEGEFLLFIELVETLYIGRMYCVYEGLCATVKKCMF